MRHYKVNKINHTVFETNDEVPADIEYLQDWRDGRISDWVLADDDCVIQILRKGIMMKSKGKVREVSYVGTCCGTFVVSDKTKMDTSRRKNIYAIGGTLERNERLDTRRNLSTREVLFVDLVSKGINPQKAYLQAYPTNDPGYAGLRAGQLVRTERIRTAMKEELKPILEELGINEASVLRNINQIATSSDKEHVRLSALKLLSDILDLEDKTKTSVTNVSGVMFEGFTQDKLKEATRPKEITNGK